MATDAVRIDVPQPESIEQLAREAELLKNKLTEEKAKLNDVDCKFNFIVTARKQILACTFILYFSRLLKISLGPSGIASEATSGKTS